MSNVLFLLLLSPPPTVVLSLQSTGVRVFGGQFIFSERVTEACPLRGLASAKSPAG